MEAPEDSVRCGWTSPRASFDFAISDRASPEKRKRDDFVDDKCSSEFEFRLPCSTFGALTVSSADELFCDGKLRPFHLLQEARSEQVVPCFSSEMIEVNDTEPLQMVGRLAFERSGLSSISLEIDRARDLSSCIGLESSRPASPSRSLSLPGTTPTSPKAAKATSKFKDLFKIGKLQSNSSQELTESSNPKKITASRSFWPFSRSNSASERKTNVSVTLLSRRSNSAGESKTTSSDLLPSKVSVDKNSKNYNNRRISGCSSAEYLKRDGNFPCITDKEVHGLSLTDEKENRKYALDSVSASSPIRVKGLGSPVRIQRKSVVRPVRNGGKGSPGRGNCTPSRRVHTNSKAFVRSQDSGNPRKHVYSGTAVRLIPVLNVTTCMGPLRGRNAAKNSTFNLRTLFSKKEKASDTSAKNRKNGG